MKEIEMQAVPAQVQLGFTQVEGGTLQQVMVVKVKVYNASSLPSRLHLHPLTSRSVFKATLTKHSTLAPGMCDVLSILNCLFILFIFYFFALYLNLFDFVYFIVSFHFMFHVLCFMLGIFVLI